MSTKFEINWRQKSLEDLEARVWPAIRLEEVSYLVRTSHELRKKPLQEFGIEDLRIMTGQNIGLKYLMPLAIERLSEDLFAEGDYYPGDLLKSVLHVDPKFWSDFPELWTQLSLLISGRQDEIESHKIPTDLFYAAEPTNTR